PFAPQTLASSQPSRAPSKATLSIDVGGAIPRGVTFRQAFPFVVTKTLLPSQSTDVLRGPAAAPAASTANPAGATAMRVNMRDVLADNRVERLFPDRQRLVELCIGEDERRQHADAVRVDACFEEEEPALSCEFE